MENETVVDSFIAPKQVPDLTDEEMKAVLRGSLEVILSHIGSDDKVSFVKAIREHTSALSVLVPKYDLTATYLEERT